MLRIIRLPMLLTFWIIASCSIETQGSQSSGSRPSKNKVECQSLSYQLLDLRHSLATSGLLDAANYHELLEKNFPEITQHLSSDWQQLSGPTVDADGLSLLGRGFGSKVYRLGNQAIKFPLYDDSSARARLLSEFVVSHFLQQHQDVYHIKTDKILAYGDKFSYLAKSLIKSQDIASNIPELNQEQLTKLAEMFENAKKLARDTGIGLDIKDANLAWLDVDGVFDWVLFDPGPRLSYRPYGFTTDLSNFDQYLRVWRFEDP